MGTENPLVEREEGLRHSATRALCIIVLLAWIVLSLFVVTIFYEVFLRRGAAPGYMDRLFAPLIVVAALMWISVAALWLWRRCDRCRRRLFMEGQRSFLTGWLPRLSAFDRNWHKQTARWMGQAPERDYRAKTLLGSYRTRAIAEMALAGRLRCQWCGHMDGATPEYVVTATK